MPSVAVRPAESNDVAALAAIYNHYIEHTIITFEDVPVTADDFAARVNEVTSSSLPYLVAEDDGRVLGYAYAAPWRERSAYRYSVEASVYLGPDDMGRGIGSMLYSRLFAELEAEGVHVVIGGISLPNAASVALHEKFGMHKVAHFEQVGFKLDRWIDVGYWQRTFGAS